MDELKFCVLRESDDTLSVYFSDGGCILGFDEKDVDLFVFDYQPDVKKTQVFDLEQFSTCH
ncbi:MAG: hypothetical protein SVK08_12325 [Halobacteriota archaeon]|nr:hypothetical protein [Halobacteriota archaeon]